MVSKPRANRSTAEQVNACLCEIAPTTAGDARSLAKCVAVVALRRWQRNLAPFAFGDDEHGRALERESVNAMCYEFATLHLLMTMTGDEPASANFAEQIMDAWNDGGEVGEWLWEHARDLGIDTAEMTRLEDAWQAAAARKAADEARRKHGAERAGDGRETEGDSP